jgi:3-dehydroquinate synthase
MVSKGKMTSMKKVKVGLKSGGYEIRIGSGLLPQVGHWLRDMGFSRKAVVITDTSVRELYADALAGGLTEAGFRVDVLEVPVGEKQKNLETAGRLYQWLTGAYAERTTPVLALGGGVIGDLAGFVAATYMRGVPLVQVPTTLLAQVDSSIGGKTAVDCDQLKNMIGVFYQPRLVVADIDTLKTLPEAELANGMAEAIKMSAIMSPELLEYIDRNIKKARALETAVLEEIVYRSARLKAGVVVVDERESGLRAVLNYGHTVGHAIEAVSGFRLSHGQAVAIGMVAEAEISRRMGMLDRGSVTRLKGVIRKAGLPVDMPAMDIREVMTAMRHDKKVAGDTIRFVLLKSIGDARITDKVSPSLVEEVLYGDG